MARTLLVLLLAPALAGCLISDWKYVRERPSKKAETLVEIVTDPPDCEITVNGQYVDNSPCKVRLVYPHRVMLYERRNWWPYPHMDEMEFPKYYRNKFKIQASKIMHVPAEEVLSLHGEEKQEVHIMLYQR